MSAYAYQKFIHDFFFHFIRWNITIFACNHCEEEKGENTDTRNKRAYSFCCFVSPLVKPANVKPRICCGARKTGKIARTSGTLSFFFWLTARNGNLFLDIISLFRNHCRNDTHECSYSDLWRAHFFLTPLLLLFIRLILSSPSQATKKKRHETTKIIALFSLFDDECPCACCILSYALCMLLSTRCFFAIEQICWQPGDMIVYIRFSSFAFWFLKTSEQRKFGICSVVFSSSSFSFLVNFEKPRVLLLTFCEMCLFRAHIGFSHCLPLVLFRCFFYSFCTRAAFAYSTFFLFWDGFARWLLLFMFLFRVYKFAARQTKPNETHTVQHMSPKNYVMHLSLNRKRKNRWKTVFVCALYGGSGSILSLT